MDSRRHARHRISRGAAAGALAARRFPDFTRRPQLDFRPELFSVHGIAFGISLQLGICGSRANHWSFPLRHRNRAGNFHHRLPHPPRRRGRIARPAPVITMRRSGIASRTRELAVACIAVLLLVAPAWAHVGNPDVYFQGAAGPYHLIITIRTPQMIPGTADVEILSATPGVSKITVVPLYIVGPGAKYPPVGDLLTQSQEDPQYFSGKIWLMESGSWQVRVQVEGAQGAGELAVPVPAAARRTLPMEKSLGILLFALMSLLVVAIISIVGAARREATLPPGEFPSLERSRRGRWMMLGTAVVIFG